MGNNQIIQDLEAIKDDIQGLVVLRYIYREVDGIIKNNSRIKRPSAYYEWISYMYAVSASVRVRRLIDKDERSISLYNLLKHIKDNAEMYTVKTFAERYPSGMEYIGNNIFQEKFGILDGHIDPSNVESDIQSIQATLSKITKYTNKRIAHLDRSDYDSIPNYNDLDDSIEQLEDIAKKYTLLLQGVDLDFTPHFQYDWKEIFRYQWID